MYLSVPLHHSYLIVSTFWLSHKVSMRSIFCSLFFKRFFYYCILFRHRQRKFNGNSCRKNAAKNAQQDTQNSPAKPHFDSVFLSISNIFSNETGSLLIRVGFLFWNIFTLLRSWTKLQIGLKAYKLYAKSAASLGKCSAALSAHYPISGPPPGLPACLHLRLVTQGKPYVGALARSVQCGHNYR